MTKLYVLTKTMYFPGSFLKGFWEHLVCRILHIPIRSADHYVTRNALCGHVEMVPTETPAKAFWVCLLPGLLNLLVGLPIFLAGAIPLGYLGVDVMDPLSGSFCPPFILYCLLFLLGSAFLCNLFPRKDDILHCFRLIFKGDSHVHTVGKVFAFLPTVLMLAGSFLEEYCLTFLLSVSFLAIFILY